MKKNLRRHRRRSIRLKGHDYGQAGAYFVTIVACEHECLFGEIINAEMRLNDHGQVVDECWRAIPTHFANVQLGTHMIMPNHVHGIIQITDDGRGEVLSPRREVLSPKREETRDDPGPGNPQYPGGGTPPLRKPTLGQIVAYFKYRSTKEMNLLADSGMIEKFWQRNYHEHIIRSDRELDSIRNYIDNNPANWEYDQENL